MRIVGFDTAGPVVGVALWVDGAVTERAARITRGAESLLLPWVMALLEEASLTPADLDAVAVAAGPGAFTGLRVGLASAAGFAMAAGCPLWSGSALASRARQAEAASAGRPVLALLDARKSKVYGLALDADGTVLGGPADVPPEEALAWMEGPFAATGEGAVVYGDAVRAAGGACVPGADDPAVAALVAMAAEGMARGEGHAPTTIQPVYLRAPDAKPSNKGRI